MLVHKLLTVLHDCFMFSVSIVLILFLIIFSALEYADEKKQIRNKKKNNNNEK